MNGIHSGHRTDAVLHRITLMLLFQPVIIYPTGPAVVPVPPVVPEPPPVNPRERITLAKIGQKYIAIQDVEPVLEEWDLRLWKGIRVDGM